MIAAAAVTGMAQAPTAPPDTSRHHRQTIAVDANVSLEVLDWGGTGHPIVVLHGGGGSAHDYDDFGPKLSALGHVYGITRRGSGTSSKPTSGYDADRLGQDVLAVIDSLRLVRPLLIGSSHAGEELSWIGSSHPTKVCGLVYVDAIYAYSLYDSTQGNLGLEMADLRRKMTRVESGPVSNYRELSSILRAMSEVDLPRLQRSLRSYANSLDSVAPARVTFRPTGSPVTQQIDAGVPIFDHIDAPVLAFFPLPHAGFPAEFRSVDSTAMLAAAATLRRVVPTAKVVMVPNAEHLMWRTSEAGLLAETSRFMASVCK